MKIEFLFPESANLFGELGDMDYIRQIFPQAEIIETQIMERPRFLGGDVDLVFMAPMSERIQELAIAQLKPYAAEIREQIKTGTHFLWIGNAMEILGTYIETDQGEKIEGLGIFPLHAKRQMLKRLSSLFLGSKEGIEIVGAKAQFTQQYLEDESFPSFCQVKRGIGLHVGSEVEGIHYKNFIGTAILGPFLILNPPFVERWVEALTGHDDTVLPFAALNRAAYEKRVKELRDPKTTL